MFAAMRLSFEADPPARLSHCRRQDRIASITTFCDLSCFGREPLSIYDYCDDYHVNLFINL